jgi:hypothetical protein
LEQFRINAYATVAESIPLITRERGSRITEKELDLTMDVTGLAKITASVPQLERAIQTLLQINQLRLDSELVRAGVEPPEDLETEEGVLAMAARLKSLGFTDEMGADTINNMTLLRREQYRVVDPERYAEIVGSLPVQQVLNSDGTFSPYMGTQ